MEHRMTTGSHASAAPHRAAPAYRKRRRAAQETGLDSLVFDLVEWVGKEPRTYSQVMEAWRTSCPRLAVWEEAVDRGYLARSHDGEGAIGVRVTVAGRAFLKFTARRQHR
jgi:hypothetical protein